MTLSRLFLSGALALTCAAIVTTTTATAEGSPQSASVTDQAAQKVHIERGRVVSATPVEDLTAPGVSQRVSGAGIDASDVRFGVTAYRVVYRTIDTEGRPTTASQLVALPDNNTRALRVVSWLHGTTVHRRQVASVNATSTDRTAALLFASTGYAVSAPDYLGLGENDGYHPYGHPEATVTASVDALRATRTFVRESGRRLDRRVLISGFSQGGPATMMVGRALQKGADPYFRPGALAPIAGPFNLSSFEAAAADDRIDNSQLYLAYFVTAWDRMYDLYDSPSEAFQDPYDETVENLFDGNHLPADIAAKMPENSEKLFTADFLQKVRNPTGKLERKLRALDTTCDWRPTVPVQIYHAEGDRDVWFEHAQHCQNQLQDNGAHPRLTDLGAFDHNASVRKALPLVIQQFNTSR